MKYILTFKTVFTILFLAYALNTSAQQSFDASKTFFQDFCSSSLMKNEHVKDYSNISNWVNNNLEPLFYGFGPYSLSSRNESRYMPLSVYDNRKGIKVPIYDNNIVFVPTASPKKRANRNRYRIKTECTLSILSYCNEDFVKSFDYKYNSYFEIGAYRLKLNVKQILAHALNTLVDHDYKSKESAVSIFIKEINKNENVNIKIPNNDDDNAFQNLVKALQAKYSEKQIFNLIFKTFLEKEKYQDTETALNSFYRKFSHEQFIPFINKELNYNLKVLFEDSGVLKVSNNIIELVNKDTKEVIRDESGYVNIPISKIVDFNFAIDNVPRLTMSFDINNRDHKLYKINSGFNRSVVKKYEKITKENPKYLEISHMKVVYYNDRIQITVSTSEDSWENYASYQIINEKRETLLPSN